MSPGNLLLDLKFSSDDAFCVITFVFLSYKGASIFFVMLFVLLPQLANRLGFYLIRHRNSWPTDQLFSYCECDQDLQPEVLKARANNYTQTLQLQVQQLQTNRSRKELKYQQHKKVLHLSDCNHVLL